MTFRSLVLGTAFIFVAIAGSQATMGAKTIFERLDADHDGTVSRSEVIAAAKRRYDLIASKNGGRVTLLALGGRLSTEGVQDITKADESMNKDESKNKKADPNGVSRDQYIEQTEKAFDQAKFGKPSENRSDDDSLTLGEMSAKSAENLIDLLE